MTAFNSKHSSTHYIYRVVRGHEDILHFLENMIEQLDCAQILLIETLEKNEYFINKKSI